MLDIPILMIAAEPKRCGVGTSPNGGFSSSRTMEEDKMYIL